MFKAVTRRAALALVAVGMIAGAPAMALAGPKLVIDINGQAKGTVVIDLDEKAAPNHVARLIKLAESGAYDGVVFHRVISGFMAQTGDVAFGKRGGDTSLAGRGGSDLPDLKAEFSNIPFKTGTVGMARGGDPNSANSQFFIMFDDGPSLNGQYTVVGQVESGMSVVRAIKKGRSAQNGAVTDPDYMVKVRVRR
jgi:peptidylprolyl isomerase